MMAIIHIVTSFQFFNLSSKIETVRGHNISLHTHSNMTSVLKVSPIDIAYELSEYKNKTISANGLMEIFDNVLQSKRCLVDKDNIDELIPDWKSFKRIIIEYEFQRRIPCIYIKVRAIRKSDGMSVGRIDGVENALHDRVQRLICLLYTSTCLVWSTNHTNLHLILCYCGVDFRQFHPADGPLPVHTIQYQLVDGTSKMCIRDSI